MSLDWRVDGCDGRARWQGHALAAPTRTKIEVPARIGNPSAYQMPQRSINGRAGMLIGFFEGAESRGGRRSVMMVPASFKLLLMDACQLPRQLLQAVDSRVCRRKLSRTGILDLLSATPPPDGADAASL